MPNSHQHNPSMAQHDPNIHPSSSEGNVEVEEDAEIDDAVLETVIDPPWQFPKRKFGATSPNPEERKSRAEDDDTSLANSFEALSVKSPIQEGSVPECHVAEPRSDGSTLTHSLRKRRG